MTHSGEGWWYRNIGFRGCDWPGVLEPGASTNIGRCLQGRGRVTLQAARVDEDADDIGDGDSGEIDDSGSEVAPLAALTWAWYESRAPFEVDLRGSYELRLPPDGLRRAE